MSNTEEDEIKTLAEIVSRLNDRVKSGKMKKSDAEEELGITFERNPSYVYLFMNPQVGMPDFITDSMGGRILSGLSRLSHRLFGDQETPEAEMKKLLQHLEPDPIGYNIYLAIGFIGLKEYNKAYDHMTNAFELRDAAPLTRDSLSAIAHSVGRHPDFLHRWISAREKLHIGSSDYCIAVKRYIEGDAHALNYTENLRLLEGSKLWNDAKIDVPVCQLARGVLHVPGEHAYVAMLRYGGITLHQELQNCSEARKWEVFADCVTAGMTVGSILKEKRRAKNLPIDLNYWRSDSMTLEDIPAGPLTKGLTFFLSTAEKTGWASGSDQERSDTAERMHGYFRALDSVQSKFPDTLAIIFNDRTPQNMLKRTYKRGCSEYVFLDIESRELVPYQDEFWRPMFSSDYGILLIRNAEIRTIEQLRRLHDLALATLLHHNSEDSQRANFENILRLWGLEADQDNYESQVRTKIDDAIALDDSIAPLGITSRTLWNYAKGNLAKLALEFCAYRMMGLDDLAHRIKGMHDELTENRIKEFDGWQPDIYHKVYEEEVHRVSDAREARYLAYKTLQHKWHSDIKYYATMLNEVLYLDKLGQTANDMVRLFLTRDSSTIQ